MVKISILTFGNLERYFIFQLIIDLIRSNQNPTKFSFRSTFFYSLAGYPGIYKIIELLIYHGADVNAVNGELNTPLHFIAFHDKSSDQHKMPIGDEISNFFLYLNH